MEAVDGVVIWGTSDEGWGYGGNGKGVGSDMDELDEWEPVLVAEEGV
jgi:hypothetical protein